MRPHLAIAFLLATTALLAAPGVGQETAPSGPLGAIYFTNKIKTDAATGVKSFNFAPDVPAAAAPLKAYAQTSLFAQTYQTQWDYAAPDDFQLSGKATVQIWVSCDVLALYRPASNNGQNNLHAVRVVLMKGGTEISNNFHYNTIPNCTGPSSVTEIKIETDTKETEFSKGNILNVQVLVWTLNPPESAAKNVHFLVGSTNRPSSLKAVGLPLPPGSEPAAPAAKIIEDTLDGETAAVSQSFDNATSDTYRFNWTAELANATIDHNVTVTNGSVRLKVLDAEANELLNITIDADSTDQTEVVDAKPGTWKIELAYSGFQGSTDLAIAAMAASTPPPAGNQTGGANETNEDGHAHEDEGDGGIPSLGVTWAAVVIVAAVLVRRRRA